MQAIHDLNKTLRDNRVPRKAAAVFSAGTLREVRAMIEVFDGKRKIPTAEYFEQKHPRQYKEVQDSLRMIGLPASQIAYVLKLIAYEIATRDLVPDAIDFVLDEQIRDAFVAQGVINESQYRDGIDAKFAA